VGFPQVYAIGGTTLKESEEIKMKKGIWKKNSFGEWESYCYKIVGRPETEFKCRSWVIKSRTRIMTGFCSINEAKAVANLLMKRRKR
jgi:hypothetical protein